MKLLVRALATIMALFVLEIPTAQAQIQIGTGKAHYTGHTVVANGKIYSVNPLASYVSITDQVTGGISSFGVLGTSNGEFNTPSSIAADESGLIYVADQKNHRIQIFNSTGGYVGKFGTFGSANGLFDQPSAIAVRDGRIYVGEFINRRVQVFSSTAPYSFLYSFGVYGGGDGQFLNIVGLCVSQDKEIFVLDYNKNEVQVFDGGVLPGTFLRKFGATQIPNLQASDIEMDDQSGIVFVASSSVILKFDGITGSYLGEFTPFGTSNFKGIHADQVNQELWLSRQEGIIHSCDYSGGLRKTFGSNTLFPRGIATDPSGNHYLLSFETLKKLNTDGEFMGSQFIGAYNEIGFDLSGNLFAVARFSGTLTKFQYNSAFGIYSQTGSVNQAGSVGYFDITSSGDIYLPSTSNLVGLRKLDLSVNGSFGVTQPKDVITDATGNVYVSTSGLVGGIVVPMLRKFSNIADNHVVQWQIDFPASSILGGLAYDPAGFLFVVVDGKINKYNITGISPILEASLGSPGLNIGQQFAADFLHFSNGQLFISDSKADRVTILPATPSLGISLAGDGKILSGGTSNVGNVAAGSSKTVTYHVHSQGMQPIQLTGTPRVNIAGANAADFSIDESNLSSLIAGASSFQVTFTPQGPGVRSATITMLSNNSAGDFSFTIEGTSKANQSISNFAAIPQKTYSDPPFQISAQTSSGLPIAFSSTNPAVATVAGTTVTIVGVGNADIVASQAGDNAFYKADNVLRSLSVSKATLTATADNKIKTYGDVNPPLTITYTGLKQSETQASVVTSPVVANTSTTTASPAGDFAITLSGGTVTTNYVLVLQSGTLTVNKATLTATATNKAKVFGQPNPALSVTYSGFKGSDTQSSVVTTGVVAATQATSSSPVGTYPINLSGGVVTSNYQLSYQSGTLEIEKALLLATAHNKNKVYGEANPALTIAYSGLASFDTEAAIITTPVTASTNATQSSPAGIYEITLSGGALDNSNYQLTYQTGLLTIEKAPITAMAESLVRIYGDPNPPFLVTYSGFKGTDTKETVITNEVSTITIATVTSPTGNYAITPIGGLVTGNYQLNYLAGNLTINKSEITARADDKTRSYNEPNPILTITYSGFKNADSTDDIDIPPITSTEAGLVSVPGEYPITVNGGEDNNYSFVYESGVLSVDKMSQTINFSSISDKIFGGTPFSISAIATSGLDVNFASMPEGRITVMDGKVSINSPGRVIITAFQNGNEGYYSAAPVEQSFCIKPPKPILEVSLANLETPVLTSNSMGLISWYLNDVLIGNANEAGYTANQEGAYKVSTQVDDCVSEFSDEQVLVVTGDSRLQIYDGITLYPNPVVDYLYVLGAFDSILGGVFNNQNVEIAVPAEKLGERIQLDVRSLPRGTYFFRIVNSRGSHLIRFVKH